jgi:hypothetical protein
MKSGDIQFDALQDELRAANKAVEIASSIEEMGLAVDRLNAAKKACSDYQQDKTRSAQVLYMADFHRGLMRN